MAALCSVCGAKRNHSVHLRAVAGAGYHPYQNATTPGLKPVSEGMREFRRASGYDAAKTQAQGLPCQIQSPVCTGIGVHWHESLPRGRAGGLRASLASGFPVFWACDACNDWCSGEGQQWARDHGFLFSIRDIEGKA